MRTIKITVAKSEPINKHAFSFFPSLKMFPKKGFFCFFCQFLESIVSHETCFHKT